VRNWEKLVHEVLSPLAHVPRHPLLLARFGVSAIQSAQSFAQRHFKGPRARALFAGVAGHGNMPLHVSPTAGFGVLLGTLGHAVGWPLAKGGSQEISNALSSYLISLGGKIVTFRHIRSLRELPSSHTTLLDVSPRQVVRLAGDQLPPGYRYELEKYRHGPGVFKVDWALNSPIPWKAARCSMAGTIHLGGTLEEMTEAELAVARGRHADRPFVLLAQQSLFDDTRAPAGNHTAWAYCHVPNGSKIDMTERIEAQVERFAPGFKDCILQRHIMSTADFETYNPNYVGGDITGGLQNPWQVVARPALRLNPYTTPVKGLYICSASTPPGGGVHGMCGFHAARAALDTVLYNRRNR
jgi:phytoene dehydrogenase-like protein